MSSVSLFQIFGFDVLPQGWIQELVLLLSLAHLHPLLSELPDDTKGTDQDFVIVAFPPETLSLNIDLNSKVDESNGDTCLPTPWSTVN